MDNGCIGITSRDWFVYLKKNSITQDVNFWRKNTDKFNILSKGQPFFFMVKNDTGIRGEKKIQGYGIFKEFKILDIEQAWTTYQNRNGVGSKQEFLNLTKEVLGTNTEEIGCIILDNLIFFDKPVILSKLGVIFNKYTESYKTITDRECNLIINYEKKWNLEEVIIQDLESEEEEIKYQFNENGLEGKVKYVYSKKYERDPGNRGQAILIHGTKCKICGFDFEEVYGDRGKRFIEIHHINPLFNVDKEVVIDPEKDLMPVCANCHRMIHRRKDSVLSIEQMKQIIESNKKGKSNKKQQ
jgi:5-methylcytosine-specific restriction endonuclease McrA